VFTVTLPVRYPGAEAAAAAAAAEHVLTPPNPALIPVLVVEDETDAQLVIEKMLRGSPYTGVPARNLRQAREALARNDPAVVLLDIQLGHEMTWKWLGELKSAAGAPPVVVMTSVDDPRKSFALGADAYLHKPVERQALLKLLDELAQAPILVIDDDPAARYTIRRCFDGVPYRVVEAADAREGLRAAQTLRPELIVLDLSLPDRRGEEVLRELAADEATRGIPVIIATSERLTPELRSRLGGAMAVMEKGELRRETFASIVQGLRPRAQPAAAS
jgi:CheY-like chemotaxis protein